MPSNVAYAGAADLPETLPLFPLPGALLLPRGQIPLNIFEPRYLAMMDAALASTRLIGMVQPDPEAQTEIGLPGLFRVGCAGRITQFAETGDGRYLIQLSGICRFHITEELLADTPFRQAQVDFVPYEMDLDPRYGQEEVDREALLAALRAFSEANQVRIDWKNINDAPNEALVNALSMMSPYGVREKQALLEAQTLKTRADMLIAITEFELARESGPNMQ